MTYEVEWIRPDGTSGVYYCGKDTKWVYWGVFLAVLFSLNGFAYGGRIEGIQILLR